MHLRIAIGTNVEKNSHEGSTSSHHDHFLLQVLNPLEIGSFQRIKKLRFYYSLSDLGNILRVFHFEQKRFGVEEDRFQFG